MGLSDEDLEKLRRIPDRVFKGAVLSTLTNPSGWDSCEFGWDIAEYLDAWTEIDARQENPIAG